MLLIIWMLQLKRISSADVPMPYALNLEKESLPSVKKIINAVKEVCYKNNV